MTIRSQYSSNCTHCRRAITPGDHVNWVKGIKGVTCVACPPPGVQSAPEAVAPALQAALADGQALRARVGELEALLATAREHYRAIRGERDALGLALTRAKNVLGEVQRERNELLARAAVDDENRIERRAAMQAKDRELAQIAAEKAAKASAAVDDINDCPI